MNKVSVLTCVIPDGIEIRNNENASGLVATRFLNKGELVYSSTWVEIPNEKPYEYKVDFFNMRDEHVITLSCFTLTHSVKCGETRQMYGFDCVMNHSCNPNTLTKSTGKQAYDIIATSDIHPGEEITCNYATIDYDSDGESFQCWCGSNRCYGNVGGFANLTLEQQVELLPEVYDYIKTFWLNDHPEIVLIEDNKCPSGVEIVFNERGDGKLVAKKEFEVGECLYVNTASIISGDKTIVMKVNNKYITLPPAVWNHKHITIPEACDFYYFDTYRTFSESEGNCIAMWKERQEYQVIATKSIQPGDILSCEACDMYRE